eukprot:TRINITY_DN4119_c0_g1_i1.p1 TRINITY_DN4119_c0_g1~~TRINITY_DN4119_c0_g1_i1.p1  ORF type:complete len:330 (+),score=164.52 TRINITY_DN4119_c0_g1_i1:75-1064(+)
MESKGDRTKKMKKSSINQKVERSSKSSSTPQKKKETESKDSQNIAQKKKEEDEDEEQVHLFKKAKVLPKEDPLIQKKKEEEKKSKVKKQDENVEEEEEEEGSRLFKKKDPIQKIQKVEEKKEEIEKKVEDEDEEKSWEDLGVLSWISKACKELGMNIPTSIQRQSIPSILNDGRDVIGASPTGSGKTAAFALPIIQNLCEDPFGIFAVVITPTRELALQIGDQFKAIGSPMGIKASVVIGGEQMVKQAAELAKKPHVIICTPGRLFDHIRSNSLPLNRIKFLVLDEADMLLNDEGQWKTISNILPHLGKNRSTLLFSATMGLNEERVSH